MRDFGTDLDPPSKFHPVKFTFCSFAIKFSQSGAIDGNGLFQANEAVMSTDHACHEAACRYDDFRRNLHVNGGRIAPAKDLQELGEGFVYSALCRIMVGSEFDTPMRNSGSVEVLKRRVVWRIIPYALGITESQATGKETPKTSLWVLHFSLD